jgi:hypothetical protein
MQPKTFKPNEEAVMDRSASMNKGRAEKSAGVLTAESWRIRFTAAGQ